MGCWTLESLWQILDPALCLSLGHFDEFWYPDLMTCMIKVRWKESVQTCLKLERKKEYSHLYQKGCL